MARLLTPPPATTPVTPAEPARPAAAPPALAPGPTYTALEAISRADAVLQVDGQHIWLITAEARPEPVGGRLGAAREWVLLYRQLGGPLRKVTVVAGGDVRTESLPGGIWDGSEPDRFRIDPTAVVHDSTWATRLADAAGGHDFLTRYPGSRRLVVLDHANGTPLTWTVEYHSPDLQWTYTLILEDVSGRILFETTCEYTPAAMRRNGLPNCYGETADRDPPAIPPIEPSPHWDAL